MLSIFNLYVIYENGTQEFATLSHPTHGKTQ